MSLGVEKFGRLLVHTGDLDPIYLMLEGAQLDRATLQRWCLGYWMFYHAGVASALSELEGPAFWYAVRGGLDGAPQFPRGTERRHFRGANAEKSVAYLNKTFPDPVEAGISLERIARHFSGKPAPYAAIAAETQRWVGFGPWISFKVADMLDAVLGVPVDFASSFPGNIFDAPAKGAIWAQLSYEQDTLDPEHLETIREGLPEKGWSLLSPSFHNLEKRLQDLRVPSLGGRRDIPLRVQELETIFCKWKSHLNGHYPVGNDTREIKHALKGWGRVADICHEVLTEHQVRLFERR